MRLVLTFVILLALVFSCKIKSKNNGSAISEINISEIRRLKMDVRYLSEFSNEFEYIRPEAKPGSFFRLMGISYIGSKFIILIEKKTSQLYVFKRDGKFIGKLGNIGRGPNEYVLPSEVFVFSTLKEIHVSDFKRNQILRFDFDLNYRGKIKIKTKPAAIHKYMDKFYICAYQGKGLKENGGEVLVVRDPVSFRKQNVLFEVDSSIYKESIEISGFDTNWLFTNNGTLCFAVQTSNGISVYNVIENNLKYIHELTFDNVKKDIEIPELRITRVMYFYD